MKIRLMLCAAILWVVGMVAVPGQVAAVGLAIDPCIVQNTCFGTFSDNHDGTVTDSATHLTWMRCSMGQTWSGTTCTGTAGTYNWGQAMALTSGFAGFSDWRMPSLSELQSIVNPGSTNPAINKYAFPSTPMGLDTWSSSLSPSIFSAWAVSFFDGSTLTDLKANANYVRLVRSGTLPYTPNLSVGKAGNGTGTVTSNPAGINCGATCSANFTAGINVTLTATPDAGSVFAGWSGGGCSGTGNCTVTMSSSGSILATFNAAPSAASCTLTPSSQAISAGTAASLSASCTNPSTVTWTNAPSGPAFTGPGGTQVFNNAGVYVYSISNGAASANATITVTPQAVASCTLTPPSQTISVGASASLSASCTNPNTFTWINAPGGPAFIGVGGTQVFNSAGLYTYSISNGAASANATVTVNSSGTPTTGTAVEFYKADINHYFMTTPDEAAFIDSKPSWGWVRTGKTFNVWPKTSAPGNTSPVCRFYGLFANGTIGSHFYTVDPTECAYVKSRTDWSWGYEGDAFYAVKPISGTCPSGTSPIYRAFNNGMGGAPNHRYMTSQADVNTMVAQGWVLEGTALCGGQ